MLKYDKIKSQLKQNIIIIFVYKILLSNANIELRC